MNRFSIRLAAILVLSSAVLRAEEKPEFPEGVVVGKALYEWPGEGMAGDFASSGWKLELGGTGTVEDGIMHLVTEKENVSLVCPESLSGDILVQATMIYSEETNHLFTVELFDRFGVGYNKEFQQFTLTEKDGAEPRVLEARNGTLADLLGSKSGEFTIAVAVTPQKIVVWLNGRPIFEHEGEDLASEGPLRFRSGWDSDWKLSRVSVYQLEKLPW